MTEINQEKKTVFSDYLFILFRWKKFILINTFLILILFTIIAFIIPKQYKASATIMIPPDNQNAFGGLSSLLGGKTSLSAMGSRIFGLSSTSEDVLLGILNSRTALAKVITRFDLMKYYDINDNNFDKVLKEFKADYSADPNEYGMIDITVINKDPKIAADIANYFAFLVDSLNIVYTTERAKNNRLFVEQRYLKNIEDLRTAEDSLYKFQKKYGIVAVPEQLEVTIKAAAEIETQLNRKEIEAFFIKQQFGEDSPQYMLVKQELNLLKKKVQELKNSNELATTSNVLFPFKTMPDIAIQYLRVYRDVQIQQSILEFVLPMYEQSKVEEQKSTPTVMVIDKAIPPELKFSPKRSVIILGPTLLFFLFLIPMVFWLERNISLSEFNNPLQQKFKIWAEKTRKFYKIKP
ncbi:Polysaccharide biosynthesis protein [Ignavibacterium album JCM 16511]|uniref:Polysaccharide biosynthesis protein n=1 Tax=Ignavibacterium album (strain DSM 19864 / JCM 16511 / NBRC 101810 / Mat9-16) TaxID=945713 RepID=I0AHJ3_IGNAJ|nr:Wzz/FepE/Etk N-terminal domain-containing protein [Ignavibacterium album]AFH48450.1 Polysaccharide biosynthesis protein [Ignavibacterium album JCM 16511]